MSSSPDQRPSDKGDGDPTEPVGWLTQAKAFLQRRENQTVAGAFVLFAGFLWIGLELIDKAKIFEESMQGFLSGAFAPPATGHIERWFLFTSVLFLAILFSSLLYAAVTLVATRSLRRSYEESRAREAAVRAEFRIACTERDEHKGAWTQALADKQMLHDTLLQERSQFQKDLMVERERLDGIMSETVRNVSMISRQMFRATASAKGKSFRSARISYRVFKNFDAEVHRRYVIRAGDVRLHFWVSSVSASGDSDPTATFSDINYQLVGRGSEAVYLPTENDRYNKAACIFFLPALEPGEEREIEVVYRWPGLLKGLQRIGWEDFTCSFKSADPIEDFEFEIFLEDGTGGQIYLTEVGFPMPEKTLESAKNDQGWRGWRYTGKNIPPALLSEDIAIRAEWKR